MYCPKCGTGVPEGQNTCPNCESPLPLAPNPPEAPQVANDLRTDDPPANDHAAEKKPGGGKALFLVAIVAGFAVLLAILLPLSQRRQQEENAQIEQENIEWEQNYAQETFGQPEFRSNLPQGTQSLEASKAAWEADEQGFWHARLSDRARQLYDLLYPHIEAMETDFFLGTYEQVFPEQGNDFPWMGQEDTDAAFESFWNDLYHATYAIRSDHPELFWFVSTGEECTASWGGDIGGVSMSGFATYEYSPEEVAELQPQVEATVQEAISAVPTDGTDYEQAAAAFQWVVENITYDQATSDQLNALRNGEDAPKPDSMRDDGQTIVSALVEHNSVCAGYSRAYQLILSRLGIPCTYVAGYWEDNELPHEEAAHAWNLVCLAGAYGWVDTTASDMEEAFVYEGEYTDVELPGVWWMYFFMTDEDMEFDQRRYEADDYCPPVTFPACDTSLWEENHFEPLSEEDVEYDPFGNTDDWSWRQDFDWDDIEDESLDEAA